MNLQIPITPEVAERWISRMAILWIASPIPLAATIVVFSQDRIFLAAYGIVFFCIGLMLNRASRHFRTNLPAAIALVERSLHLVAASAFVALAYICWTTPVLFTSVEGIGVILTILTLMVLAFLFLRKVINSVRHTLITYQQTKEPLARRAD
jgi:hypothetical protein